MIIIIIIGGGLILSASIGAFAALLFTNEMKDSIAKTIVGILIALTVGFGIAGLIAFDYKCEAQKWNNGNCATCGEAWELFEIENSRTSGEVYYYKCENNHIIKTSEYFE